MHIGFETSRLSARQPVAGDAARVTELMQDKDLPWMLARAPWPYGLADARSWIEAVRKASVAGEEYAFLLHHADLGLIGSCGMTHSENDIWEIGFWIGKPFWREGYVSEGARGLLDWAKIELGITRWVAGHIDDNPASGRVLMKLGFEIVGELGMRVKGRDCEVNAVRYVYGGAPAEVALKVPGH